MQISSRKLCALIVFAGLVAISGCSKPDYETAGGQSGHFSDARGKWLLINYWAEWCKPCIEEMPELHRFQQEQSNRVVLLTVNYDGVQGPALQQQIKKLGIALPVLLNDPSSVLGFKRPDALPTTLVFDPEGVLRQTLQGPQTASMLAASIESAPQGSK
jgi:thiol-disulfide isomerase/thioredoxin